MPARLRIPGDDPRTGAIRVSNPLSIDHSALRTTLVGSLLDAARYNRAHGADRVALFECGRAYLREGSSPAGGVLGGEFAGERPAPAHEPQRIACLASGPLREAGWRDEARGSDFHAIKGILEALAAQLGAEAEVEAAEEPFLHPGRAGRILVGGEPAGWIGELHPLVCRAWDLEAASGFELELAALVAASPYGLEQYEDVISYPAVHQDVAVVVPAGVEAARVREAVLAGGGELLRSARVFDLYTGEQLGEDRKSLALRLEFRAADRTLTDEEVAGLRERITESLAGIGGSLRE
jgi:phenylalanyl-tRNA synthetase beta chain